MPQTDTTATDAPARTVEDRIDALHDERAKIAADEQADPIRAAVDVNAWHERDATRRRRNVEIESTIRSLEEYRELADDPAAMAAIRTYLGVARATAQRHARVLEHRIYTEMPGQGAGGHGQGGHRDVEQWWQALAKLARVLPHESDGPARDAARALLTREAQAWFDFRNAWAVARVAWIDSSAVVPSPEAGRRGELPYWLRYGAHRLDRVDNRATS